MTKDYSGQNLRGRSFKGQDLEGADFSYADIRGADFTGANLRGTNFSHAEAGLQKRRIVFLLVASFFIFGIFGLYFAFVGIPLSTTFNSTQNSSKIILVISIILLIWIIRGSFKAKIDFAKAITKFLAFIVSSIIVIVFIATGAPGIGIIVATLISFMIFSVISSTTSPFGVVISSIIFLFSFAGSKIFDFIFPKSRVGAFFITFAVAGANAGAVIAVRISNELKALDLIITFITTIAFLSSYIG